MLDQHAFGQSLGTMHVSLRVFLSAVAFLAIEVALHSFTGALKALTPLIASACIMHWNSATYSLLSAPAAMVINLFVVPNRIKSFTHLPLAKELIARSSSAYYDTFVEASPLVLNWSIQVTQECLSTLSSCLFKSVHLAKLNEQLPKALLVFFANPFILNVEFAFCNELNGSLEAL